MDDRALRARVEGRIVAGDLEGARLLCEARVAANHAPPFFPLTLARIAFVQGRVAEARGRLRALAVGADAATLVASGALYEALHAPGLARACYARALRLDGTAVAPHQKLYALHRAAGETQAASRHLEAVLRLEPDGEWGRLEQAARLFDAGAFDEALARFQVLPTAFAAYACGEILLRRGEGEAARAWYRRAAAREPGAPWPTYRAALLEARRGDVAAALRWLGAARGGETDELRGRLDPGSAEAALAGFLPDPSRYPDYAARLADLAAGRCVLHAYRHRRGWTRIRLRLVRYRHASAGDADDAPFRDAAERLLEDVAAFHRVQFGSAAPLEVVSDEVRSGGLDFEYFENAVAHESFAAMCRALAIRRVRPGEAVLVLWWGGAATAPLSRGFGGYGYAAVECAPTDPYLAAIAAHELYHATLGLFHTDGDKDVAEIGGLMGWPGAANRLADTWLHYRHRALCATYPEAQAAVRAAHRADRQSDWGRAARLYGEALRRDPLYLWAATRLAQVEVHRGRYEAAARILEEVLRNDGSAEHAVQLAHVRLDQGRVGRARALLEGARGWGRTERTHLLAGLAWSRGWRYREAAACFRAALALNPCSQEALANLACTMHDLGRLRAAERLYRRALRLDPHWAEVHDRLALLHAERGDFAAAGRCLRRAGGLKPGDSEHLLATARVRCLEGRWEGVPRLMRRLLRKDPHTASAQLLLGYAHLVLGDVAAARGWFAACHRRERLSPWGRTAGAWMAALDPATPPRILSRHQRAARRLDRRDPRCVPLLHLLLTLEIRDRAHFSDAAAGYAGRLLALQPRHPWRDRLREGIVSTPQNSPPA